MEKIAVYNGTGAALAGDVAEGLEELSRSFVMIDDPAALTDFYQNGGRILIVPGGYTERIARGWGEEGIEAIREFVKTGGAYIGICAGAYLAAERVKIGRNPPGLDLLPIDITRRSGLKIVTVSPTDPADPLVRNCPEKIRIWYQNGPLIRGGDGVEIPAVFDDGAGAAARGRFEKGKVVLFSPHPEGSSQFKISGRKLGSLCLLENALRWVEGE